ncbi:MAG: hypothetical protein K0R41_2477 [Geminicoccaceae bacterium]|nr:hypothetical protein [Geminicoccaceae bacterium]
MKGTVARRPVGDDRQLLDHRDEGGALGGLDPAAPLAHHQPVGDLVIRVPEVVPGYPDRLLPKDKECAEELKKRTLARLYNQRPARLATSIRKLEAAVAAACGWPADLPDNEIPARFYELNQARGGPPCRRGGVGFATRPAGGAHRRPGLRGGCAPSQFWRGAASA